MRTRWATVAVVVVVAATFALLVRPPIKDPATAHQLISMQRDIDAVAVRFNGPPSAQPSFSDISEALKSKQNDAAKVDATNTVRLGHILDAHGWPAVKQVGSEAVQAALDIVTRSRDIGFKERALGLMQQAGVKPSEQYARLVDMVAVAKGEPQTYGTMWTCEDGSVKLMTPVKDPNAESSLRRQAGLPGIDKFPPDFCANPGNVRIVKRRVGG